MRSEPQRRHAATRLAVAAAFFYAAAPVSAGPSMSADFKSMMQWLSHELSQGLAFNAGSPFAPPREITDRRLAPDISVGGGVVPLDKGKFPVMRNDAVRDAHTESIFPSSVLFPNLAMHLRAGLPGRFDFAIRAANMTTPPGYKISPTTTGKGQSNSLGVSLRRHFFGGDAPLLSLGTHYNHVAGRFEYKTRFGINDVQGFSADSDVNGGIFWNINSFGLNAVTSQAFGAWTPFAGFGYNYTTGSVHSKLEALPDTPLITRIFGEASDHPEKSQGRVIVGLQLSRSWVNLFTNGEIKTIGIGAGKSWIVHAGLSLPFFLGSGGGRYSRKAADAEETASARPVSARARREMFGGPVNERVEGTPTMIFIQ